jgi:ribosomal-protein-alanine N-acetyltransferase
VKEIRKETERLILRKFEITDIESCFNNWGNDDALGQYFPMYPFDNQMIMGKMIQSYINAYENDAYIWLVQEKESGELIGNISVDIPYKQLQIGEIAYLLGSKWWKRGYAFEAGFAVIQYMFQVEKLYMIEAKYNETNIASEMLLRKLGLKEDGRLRGRRISRDSGERNSLVVCSILNSEFSF